MKGKYFNIVFILLLVVVTCFYGYRLGMIDKIKSKQFLIGYDKGGK